MTVDSRQVFNHGEFYADSQHSLGLVTTHRHAQWSGEYQKYSFLHLTLQEFLAAYHISKRTPKQLVDVIDQYSSAVHTRNVWKFYFGLAKFSNEGLDGAKKIIQKTSHDVYGYSEPFPILCAYEAKQEAVVKLVSSKKFRLILQQTYDISALAYLMSKAACPDNEATPTTHLDVNDYTVGVTCDHLLSELSDRAINNLEKLAVHCNNFGGLIVDTVANKYQRVDPGSKLTSGVFKSLEVLDLNFSKIGDDSAKMIAKGLDLNHTLTHLRLRCCGIGAGGVDALMKTTCAVEDLDLSWNDIGDEEARAVAGRLKNSSSLQNLNISSCCIGPEGVTALADAISCDTAVVLSWSSTGNPTRSNSLRLVGFEFGWLLQWFRMVKKIVKQDVLYLNISNNKCISFEDDAGFSLLDHFKNLNRLLLLRKNHSLHATVKLVDYVLHKDNCRMLQYLRLSDNFPQEDIINHVILRLLNHDRLKQIYFSASPSSISPYPILHLAEYKCKYEDVMALARGIQEKQDFNYSQNYYPVLDIDIPSTMLTMEESLALLGALKHCNRIRNISFGLYTTTIQHHIRETLEDEVEKAELVKAFEHDSMDRKIILIHPYFHSIIIMTIACPHRH